MAPLPKRRISTQRKGKRRAAWVRDFLLKNNIPLNKKRGSIARPSSRNEENH